MTKFKIWAPLAKKMTVCVNGKEYAMQSENDGYWIYETHKLEHPIVYTYKIDDRGPFPDPASKFQPEGVHGASQLWPSEFDWHDQNWQPRPLSEAIVYELHIGTFTPEGTYRAAIDRLQYLKDLGISHIELMPIAAFPGKHGWGYDGVALYAPHSSYGTPDDLRHFVDTCHQNGLAVILDVVYNHLGPDGNYLGLYGPYFSRRYHTPWGEAVNYDCAGSDEVRRFIIDNAMMWLHDYHFDGLRLDAVHAIYDFSAIHILEELQAHVAELAKRSGRDLLLIAESDLNDPRLLKNRENGGYGLAAQWLDDFHHSLHVMLTGEKQGYYGDYQGVTDLHKCLNDYYVYDGCHSPMRQRRHGRPATGLAPEKFIVSTQTHDQVGNRGLGERLCQLTSYHNSQSAAALLLLSPFVPMLFQGEEWAATTPFLYFTDHTDARLARAVREGRRRDYAFLSKKVPDPQAKATFEKSILPWPETSDKEHKEMINWYRQLIKLRQQYLNEIRGGPREFKPACERKGLYIYRAGRLKTLVNISSDRQSFADATLASTPILLQNLAVHVEDDVLTLEPGCTAIMLTD